MGFTKKASQAKEQGMQTLSNRWNTAKPEAQADNYLILDFMSDWPKKKARISGEGDDTRSNKKAWWKK